MQFGCKRNLLKKGLFVSTVVCISHNGKNNISQEVKYAAAVCPLLCKLKWESGGTHTHTHTRNRKLAAERDSGVWSLGGETM